jgi:glucan phosphoethanolaminetransferase (alkaline phosphatase superfamily)
MLPIYLGFSAFGLVGKGTAAACAVATLIIAVRMHIDHVRKAWFWAVIMAVAVVDVLLIVYVPFPNKNYTFPIVAPFGYLEYVLISACIRLAENKAGVSA